MTQPVSETLENLISEYFSCLAESFPVMSASDEFHFLPRSERAAEYYGRIESFDAESIGEGVSLLKDFEQRFAGWQKSESETNALIDLELLSSSAAAILIELENRKSWKYNPLMYLKIAFIGLDHALGKPFENESDRMERSLARLSAIPRLFEQAVENIKAVPESNYAASLAMMRDAENYISNLREIDFPVAKNRFLKASRDCLESLIRFRMWLERLGFAPDSQFAGGAVSEVVERHFRCERSLSQIFEIARDEFDENLENLNELASKIEPGKSWMEIYFKHCREIDDSVGTFELYGREIDRLSSFFFARGFDFLEKFPALTLEETPVYLESVRSSASFASAFSKDEREKYVFYITPGEQRKEGGEELRQRLHAECKFLAAHETVPGHFLLDSVRRNLENPVRRQIESPLFYEGWAYYAESLLEEYDYFENPVERLVDRKRRLWRAARCMIDAGGAIDKIDRKKGIELLTACGFSRPEASAQIDRFRLNPGYQLCYSLGKSEIERLRDKYASKIGKDRFHREILTGGEIPFRWIGKRLRDLTNTNSTDQKSKRRRRD